MSMDRAISSAAPVLRPQALTAAGFASYGDVLAPEGERVTPVNDGRALRYDGLANSRTSPAPTFRFSRFIGSTPRRCRSGPTCSSAIPLSSQVFLPMSSDEFLIVVAPDRGGEPDIGAAAAFLAPAGTGIHYRPGIWHVPLVTLGRAATFAMLMWEAGTADTVEHRLAVPLTIAA